MRALCHSRGCLIRWLKLGLGMLSIRLQEGSATSFLARLINKFMSFKNNLLGPTGLFLSLFKKLFILYCLRAQSLSFLTLCDPMGCSPPGSSVHGILQARTLEWVAMPSSRGSS